MSTPAEGLSMSARPIVTKRARPASEAHAQPAATRAGSARWPRSLLGRHALLIVALILIGQVGGALLLRELVLKPRLAQAAQAVANNLQAVRAGLISLPPAQRAAFADAFNRRPAGTNEPADVDPDAVPRLSALERRFVRQVSLHLGEAGMQANWRRATDGGLALRVALDGDTHWLVLPGVLPAREFTGAWLAVSAGSGLLALLGALWLQRRLDRPLARLVQAAASLGAGRKPPLLPEDGPSEIATVSRSFNRMADSLAHQERERALMLAGISHDLRTPMTKLRLAVEIVGDAADAPTRASMVRSLEEMDGIVGQFLDYARAADDSGPLEPVDLNRLCARLCADFADHGQPVQWQPARALPLVSGSAPALRRMLANLLENAHQYGEAPVLLRSCAQGAWVWLEVIDHGPGIDPAQAEWLRQPFHRAGEARSGGAGAGLGLAIVERIAREHGGELALLQADRGGLCARVMLPHAERPRA